MVYDARGRVAQRLATHPARLPDAGLDVGTRVGRGARRHLLLPRCPWQASAGILARHEILVAARRGAHRHADGVEAHGRATLPRLARTVASVVLQALR